METTAWLILLFPLLGCIVIGLGYRVLPARVVGGLGTIASAAAFVFAVNATLQLQDRGEEQRQVVYVAWDYAVTSGVDAKMSILVDPLSMFMALVVTGVSTLIHLYSIAYLGGDRGYARFFAYLNFFVFSMLVLVLAGNFLLLIVGWAFVGAASYMLISFWYRRTTATSAGIKAFVINVLGDVGLVLGTFFIFKQSGTLDFLGTFAKAPDVFPKGSADITAGCVLLLVGAFAKSAQVPLHTWLPDAMEGPTPVSALIHAATMVTAGVYLIARMHPLFERAPAAAAVGAIVGAATLLIAGTIGLVVTDLKRVIAYSTMSQIGYMIMGVSAGAYVAGLFHLMTHAFFKALLFMAAGSVISAMAGNQNMNDMGGFRRAMPFTFTGFLVGGLALSGFPPFSGFFSKDEILSNVAAREDWHVVLAVVGFVGSLLTAIYTFRMIFRVFWGEPVRPARAMLSGGLYHAPEHTNPATGEVEDTDVGFPGAEHHVAEHEGTMKIAMASLAVLAVIGGMIQIPKVTDVLHNFLAPSFADSRYYESLETSRGLTVFWLVTGCALAIGGIALAYFLWVRRTDAPGSLRAHLSGLHRVFVNKWYFDEIIDRVIVRPFAWFGRFGRTTFERRVISGLFVGGTTGAVRAGSAAVRAAQTGYLRYYAALLTLGLTALGLYFLVAGT